MSGISYRISVIGLGYVGLPSALALHEAGHSIHGVDVSHEVIQSLREGKSHLGDQTKKYAIPNESKNWSLSSVYGADLTTSDIVIVTVPTPTKNENEPDISYVKAAFEEIMPWVGKASGKILVLESTVYPGVTRSVTLDVSRKYGLVAGIDYHIAYCPERINPGVEHRDIDNIVRIIGCDDAEIANKLVDIYSDISKAAVYCGTPEVAEAAKLIENVQRDVDIALANEMSIVLSNMNLDSEEVFKAAATKWNFHRHTPGIGVGGHCIAVDPYYYLDIFKHQNLLEDSLVTTSRSINNTMPIIGSNLIVKNLDLKKGDKVLFMGFSYKKNIGDSRNTPVRELVLSLLGKGISCEIFDPICDPRLDLVTWHNDHNALGDDYDALVISTPHDMFDLRPAELQNLVSSKNIFDGRRALNPNEFIEAGWKYSAVGY